MRIILLLILFLTGITTDGQCLKADIIFLLDWSGSEDSNRVYIPIAAHDFVNTLNVSPSAVKVGIIPFNEDPMPEHCLIPSGDKELISDLLFSLIMKWPNGGTNLNSSMMLAHSYFETSERDRGEPVMRFLFIISDGNEAILARPETSMLCHRLKSNGTLVWCIATPKAFKGENDLAREHLKELSSGAQMGYYVEQYYANIKEELLRLELCP